MELADSHWAVYPSVCDKVFDFQADTADWYVKNLQPRWVAVESVMQVTEKFTNLLKIRQLYLRGTSNHEV